MKTKSCLQLSSLLVAACVAGGYGALAQTDAITPAQAAPPAVTPATPAVQTQTPPATPEAPAPTTPVALTPATNCPTGINLNFRNAPIDLVLEHLSKAAGFIIAMDTQVRGTVSVIGQCLTREEAVDLVNSELNKNHYAAIRNGRTLRIMSYENALTAPNPVKVGGDPDSIPNNDEMVTQIIPIRFVEAGQLVSELSPFITSSRIVANQAGNSIVITDTQANIRHLVEIVKAIDSSAEDVTEVKVFHLQYADPAEMATLLGGLFPDQSGNASSPLRFNNRGRGGGGRGGFAGGGGFGGGFNPFAAAFGGGNQAGGNSAVTDRIKKRNQVVAVADGRTSSVVVTATRDLMEQITEMVDQLDHPGKTSVIAVVPIIHADPTEVLQVLQDTVGVSSSRNGRNTQSQLQSRMQQSQNTQGQSTFGAGFGNRGVGGGGGGGGRGGF